MPELTPPSVQGLPCETYVAVFDRMQSVVFVNAFGREAGIWKDFTGGQLSDRFYEGMLLCAQSPAVSEPALRLLRCADYRLEVVPDLAEAVVHEDDCLMLEQAEMTSLRTVAHVLAQTVALHFYETCALPALRLAGRSCSRQIP